MIRNLFFKNCFCLKNFTIDIVDYLLQHYNSFFSYTNTGKIFKLKIILFITIIDIINTTLFMSLNKND